MDTGPKLLLDPPGGPLFAMDHTNIQEEIIEGGQEGDGKKDSEGVCRVA